MRWLARVAAVFLSMALAPALWAQGYSVAGGTTGASATTAAPAAAPSEPSARAVPARHPWDYGGLAPGNANTPPGMRHRLAHRGAHGRRVVAWPGFQITPGGSRIFLAVTAPPTVSQEHTPGRWVITLRDATVPLRNNRRALETDAFETPVERASLRVHGADVQLVIEMRAEIEPQVTQQTNAQGLSYVYVDFTRWSPPNHVPLMLRAPGNEGVRLSAGQDEAPSGSPASAGPAASSAPPGHDDERPPPVQQ